MLLVGYWWCDVDPCPAYSTGMSSVDSAEHLFNWEMNGTSVNM